uniref:Mitochondrial import inner membrane translocase subunit TIM22 n=1 Tax=Tetradesmus obliquus TaxID=3088 RepID=A0A383WP69_TETOB|eukprot:jgi/Sobl393_1/13883/SZX79002.1
MSGNSNEENDKPWKRLYHGEEVAKSEQQQQEQQQQRQEEEELSELQQQLLTWYRKTCLVAGAGMAGSTWYWYTSGRSNHQVFLPPRAQALPPEVVEAYKKKAVMREGMRAIGRQTLFVSGVAALYFGVELGVGMAREQPGHWANTAAAGAVAGSYLGARAPSSLRGRTLALGCMAGGALGALSGWSQQKLTEMAAAAEAAAAANGGKQDNSSKPVS